MTVAFLADECFPGFLVRALLEAGFDVTRSADTHPGADDNDVLTLAVHEQRILLTEDNDFGDLAVRLKLPVLGLIRVDLKSISRDAQVTRVIESLRQLGDEVRGAIVSIEPSRTRLRKLSCNG